MRSYKDNEAWSRINALLPESFQIAESNMPVEEQWDWRGNKVHLDRYPNPDAQYRIFLHHGVGTNGRQLNMIFGHKMAALGYDIVAIDNLGYGETEVNQKDITYSDWVQLFVDFINYETKRDRKKVILYGLSAGGMMTYNAACYLDNVDAIIGMCFLKNDNKTVAARTSRYPLFSTLGTPFMRMLSAIGFKRLLNPMKLVSKMNALVNNKEALKIFLNDKSSAGGWVQTQFLYEYMSYKALIPPAEFDKCPILLTQPDDDRWTPYELTEISLKDVKAPFTVKILEGAGHYPMEENGLNQLIYYAHKFIQSLEQPL